MRVGKQSRFYLLIKLGNYAIETYMQENEHTQGSLVQSNPDPLIRHLNKMVVYCVKILAILMVVVIFLAMVDVFVHLYNQVSLSIKAAFSVENLISLLGSFLAVLIAIEIFLNIIFYLKRDAIHVPLVLSTALTAAARKVIIVDYSLASPLTLFALASLILALGVSYWLIARMNP
jgi:uncharacterized membrane protein (DUF373 family)